jgi:collagen type I/II/III/V/XI/XXIV/XXVII alpha
MPESNPWSDAIPATPPVAPSDPARPAEAPGLSRELLSELEGDGPAGPRPRVTNTATYVLLTLAVLLATFSAGAWVGRNRAPSTTRTTSAAAAGPAGAAAAAGLSGAGGFSGPAGGRGAAAAAGGASGATGAGAPGANAAGGGLAGGNLTTGTVKLVDGPNVYLATATGTVVKVTTNAQSQITVTKQGSLGDLTVGETLIVQGEAGADGTVVATSIRSGAAGGAGALGGRGQGGNGPGAGQGGSAPGAPTTTAVGGR